MKPPCLFESVLFWHWKPSPTDKTTVYAFDLDQTLVTPKSGATFPKGASDWRWQTPVTRDLVRKVAAFATIVIFTNQGAVVPNPAKKSYQNIDGRVTQVLKSLDLPNVRVFAACKNNATLEFRKPNKGMWRLFTEKYAPVVPDLEKSIYVGDAAGRKGDHSDADIGFAKAVGLRFLLPEEFCLEAESLKVEATEPETKDGPTMSQPVAENRANAEPDSEPVTANKTSAGPESLPEPVVEPGAESKPKFDKFRLNPKFPITAPKKKPKLQVKNTSDL